MRRHQQRSRVRLDGDGARPNGAEGGSRLLVIVPGAPSSCGESQDHPEAQAPFAELFALQAPVRSKGRRLRHKSSRARSAMGEGRLDQAAIRLMAAEPHVRARARSAMVLPMLAA